MEDKAAIVTGGSRGIGRAIVERLARDGAAVVFSYLRSEEAAGQVCSVVGAARGRAEAVRADQGSVEDMRRLFEIADDRFGGLDIFVANAGVGMVARIEHITEDQFDRAVAVNLKGPLFGMQEAARRLRDGGRIIYISTTNTVMRQPSLSLYCSTKTAAEQLSVVAALELAPRKITVNVVSPGATDTEMFHRANPDSTDEDVGAITPLGRIGTPSDVADVVAFLVSPEAGWLTGQHLRASGGLELGQASGGDA